MSTSKQKDLNEFVTPTQDEDEGEALEIKNSPQTDYSVTDSDDKPWKTDDLGHPDDKDYHYRIPLDDDKAMALVQQALSGVIYEHRTIERWDGFSGDKTRFIGLRTNDNKGRLAGLSEYTHSAKWYNLGPMSEIDEYRQNPNGSGVKVIGTFRVNPMALGVSLIEYEATLGVTPSELEEAYETRGDVWQDIQDTLRYVKDERMREVRKKNNEGGV